MEDFKRQMALHAPLLGFILAGCGWMIGDMMGWWFYS